MIYHYILIKDFNTFMYNHTLRCGRKHFCRYCLQAFKTADKLTCCFKINGKQSIKTPNNGRYIKFKNFGRKTKSLCIVYADFESILVPEDNGKQNLNESYTKKYQKHVACSYGYKIACVDDKLSKLFKSYLSKDLVYNFSCSMIDESKYCSDVMKKYFNKEFVMAKKDNEGFENSTKCWICDNDYVKGNVKAKNHSHITEKYRGFAHRDCNINVNLNHKIYCRISQPKTTS